MLKRFIVFLSHRNVVFFFNSSRRILVFVEKSETNRLQNVASPKNDFNSLVFLGGRAALSASTFAGSMDTPSFPITTPKKEISV